MSVHVARQADAIGQCRQLRPQELGQGFGAHPRTTNTTCVTAAGLPSPLRPAMHREGRWRAFGRPRWRKHLMRRTIALRSSTEAVLEDGRRHWVVRVSAADRRCAGVCAGCHADRRRLGHSPLREQARYRAVRVRTRSNRRSSRRGGYAA